MENHIKQILSHWNLDKPAQQIYASAWRIGDDFILKRVTEWQRMTRNIQVMHLLHEQGILVPLPIPTLSGEEALKLGNYFYLLMPKLNGIHIKSIYEEDVPILSRKTGTIVAHLHQAFLSIESRLEVADNDFIKELEGWIRETLESTHGHSITKSQINDLLSNLSPLYKACPRQLIHRDMHFGNLLFQNGDFNGYIDFDLTQKNVKVFDIAYFLVGLLQNHIDNEADRLKWLEFKNGFLEGYQELNPLLPVEIEALYPLMQAIELLFVAFFLKKGQVDFAESAEKIFFALENIKLIKKEC